MTRKEPDCVPDKDTIGSSPAVSLPALTDTPVRVISWRPTSLTSMSQESGTTLVIKEPSPTHSSLSKGQVPVFVPPPHNSPDATIPNDNGDSSQPDQMRSSSVPEARCGNQSPPSQLNRIDVIDVSSPLTDDSELQSELRILLTDVAMEPEAGNEEIASDHKEGGGDRGRDEAKGHGKGTRKAQKQKSKAKRTAVKVSKTVESTGGTSLSTTMMVMKERNRRQGTKAQDRNKTPPPKAKYMIACID